MPNYEEDILRLKQKLISLKEKDQNFLIFGSAIHKYQLNPCISNDQISVFETEHNIKLPIDYKTFISEFSNGGAGPAYGLFSLESGYNIVKHGKFFRGYEYSLSREFRHSEKYNPLEKYLDMSPYDVDIDKYEEEIINGPLGKEYFNGKQLDGSILCCDFGCGSWGVIVLNGQESGNIWGAARNYEESGIYPLNITIFDFFESWVDRSLSKIDELNEKNNKNTVSKKFKNDDRFSINESISGNSITKLEDILSDLDNKSNPKLACLGALIGVIPSFSLYFWLANMWLFIILSPIFIGYLSRYLGKIYKFKYSILPACIGIFTHVLGCYLFRLNEGFYFLTPFVFVFTSIISRVSLSRIQRSALLSKKLNKI